MICKELQRHGYKCLYTIALGTSVITGRNEVVAKVIFLHLFVILFTGGVCLSACWDTNPPWEQTPQSRPPGSRHPPGADTPGTRHPQEQTPPQDQTHPRSTPLEQTPPRADTPPQVYRQLVCILLECILVKEKLSVTLLAFVVIWRIYRNIIRVATAQGKQGIGFLLFPDRKTQGIWFWHREKFANTGKIFGLWLLT